MSIRKGTIITRYETDHLTGGCYIPCVTNILDICVGIVQVDPDATSGCGWVYWLQLCPMHTLPDDSRHEDVKIDDMWEIGQLA